MSSQALLDLEKDIADFLLAKLEHEEMTLDRAAAISRFILKSLPDNVTDDQLQQLLPKLDREFIELSLVVHKHLLEYEEKQKQNLIDEATKLIHLQKIDQASKVMNRYLLKKI